MAQTKNVRDVSLEWVERALDEEMPGEYPRANIRDLAEAMLLMVEEVQMPVEDLVTWIRFSKPGKQWTQAELRQHITAYCDLRKQLGLDPPVIQHAREQMQALEPETVALCPSCAANVAVLSMDAWHCCKCGVVEMPPLQRIA